MKIRASQDTNGFAPRDSLWTAVDDDTYDGPGSPIGAGATERGAIDELMAEIDATRDGAE